MLRRQIRTALAHTVASFRGEFSTFMPLPNAFELFGVDFLVDEVQDARLAHQNFTRRRFAFLAVTAPTLHSDATVRVRARVRVCPACPCVRVYVPDCVCVCVRVCECVSASLCVRVSACV